MGASAAHLKLSESTSSCLRYFAGPGKIPQTFRTKGLCWDWARPGSDS